MSIGRNTTINLIGSILPMFVSLLTVPIYLGLIGLERYGVLAIAWLLLGYFGLFDLGLGRATAQRVAALRDSAAVERAQVFWTALVLNVGLGVLGGILIWPVATYAFAEWFNVESVIKIELQAAIPWLVLAVPMATLSGVLSGALQGRERFLQLNIVSVLGTILFQLFPLFAATLWGANLAVILPAALFARLLTLFILYELSRRAVFGGFPITFVRKHAKLLIHFGGWVTVTAFVGPMMVILDRFVIGALAGAKAVTYYTIPFQLAERITVIPNALSAALFPRFSVESREREQELAGIATRSLIVVITPLVLLGILGAEPFLKWWISTEFAAQSALIAQVLLVGFWFNCLARIPYAQLQARGQPDLVAKCHMMEIFPYLALLYIGLKTFGIMGAALAFSIRTIIDYLILAALAQMLRQSSRLLVAPCLMLVAGFVISYTHHPSQVAWYGLASVILFITLGWAWWQSPRELRIFVLKALSPMLV